MQHTASALSMLHNTQAYTSGAPSCTWPSLKVPTPVWPVSSRCGNNAFYSAVNTARAHSVLNTGVNIGPKFRDVPHAARCTSAPTIVLSATTRHSGSGSELQSTEACPSSAPGLSGAGPYWPKSCSSSAASCCSSGLAVARVDQADRPDSSPVLSCSLPSCRRW